MRLSTLLAYGTSLAIAIAAVAGLTLAARETGNAQAGAEWPRHDGDASGSRFSTLTQITPENVAMLRVAWTFDTGTPGIQVTPLVVGGSMYLSAGSRVFALDPETGGVQWTFEAPAPGIVSRRGVAYWPGDAANGPRIYVGAGEKMLALDAKTGRPVPAFGDGGYVDLKASVRGEVDGRFSLVSPPTVYKDILITGGNNGEQNPSFGLYGDIRGWDARSGRLLWSFHTVPRPGEPGHDTWDGDSWRNRSGTNVWSFFTVDVERGVVFAPLGSPTSDYYGGDRHGANLYGNSLVALDAMTGKLKWYQQIVHHDIWDYDLPAAPTLIDVHRGGRTIPAVAVMTKMSTLFIFNRETGEPIFGVEERPVPQSHVPGEATWPTQPFPIKPAPLARMTFDPATDFYTLTPEHEAWCRELWDKNQMFTLGPFTPAEVDRTMVTFPSTLGGGNWNGLAYDARSGLAFTNVMNLGQVARMQPQPGSDGRDYARTTPWGGTVGRFWNPETKIPCSAPPFGELVAVNVNTGDIAWKVRLGFVEALKPRGFGSTGALNIGGPIVTASGLLFVGASMDRRFRAFDARTGQQLWEATLDAAAHTVPITYLAGNQRRQFVAVAAGGGSFLGSPPGTKIVAFGLIPPRTSIPPLMTRGDGIAPAGGDSTAGVAGRRPDAQPGAATTGFPGGRPDAASTRAVPGARTDGATAAADMANTAAAGPGLTALPDGEGRAAVQRMCSGCHGLTTVLAQRRTPKEWEAIVQMMASLGAPGTPSERAAVVAYLSSHLGREDSAGDGAQH